MTAENIAILNELKPFYLSYKKTLSFELPQHLSDSVQEVHRQFYGDPIPPCGGCWIRSVERLLMDSEVGID